MKRMFMVMTLMSLCACSSKKLTQARVFPADICKTDPSGGPCIEYNIHAIERRVDRLEGYTQKLEAKIK